MRDDHRNARVTIRRLDVLILLAQIFALVALSSWRGTPRVALVALVAVVILALVRLDIEYRSGVTIRAQGSTPGAWLIVAAIPTCIWWFMPRGTLTSTASLILVAMALALGAVQFFKARSPAADPTFGPT